MLAGHDVLPWTRVGSIINFARPVVWLRHEMKSITPAENADWQTARLPVHEQGRTVTQLHVSMASLASCKCLQQQHITWIIHIIKSATIACIFINPGFTDNAVWNVEQWSYLCLWDSQHDWEAALHSVGQRQKSDEASL